MALQCRQALDGPQVAEPKLFKSHRQYSEIPKGGKYIYVARDPIDVFVSFYNFLPGYVGLEAGDMTMDDFADAVFAGVSHGGQIWDHYASWYDHMKDDNVLWVFFEDLKEDLEREVRRIAKFMKLPEHDVERRITIAIENSTFKFMADPAQKHHFDDHFVWDCVKERLRIPAERTHSVSKVRSGKSGQKLPDHLRQRLYRQWENVFVPKTGCKTYEEFRADVGKTGQIDVSRLWLVLGRVVILGLVVRGMVAWSQVPRGLVVETPG
eukprot:CAMPEP_0204333362 /NCGR_PEP_ID=MMETSP0469-20131031/17167_1 /ASSEMBLY_ACC=CAM_ASM_000384 /TAXON_ID=2969 /ORGANISM="Oxyrrhis marina" /LENGTH=265 /DNA_ID=CAMNT_0051316691 /DNA_START=8 /DNA_END=806 /DNA_ORIENTATION=+